MLQVRAVSGAIIAELDEDFGLDSGACVVDLKHFLAAKTGYSRFRQRLLDEDGDLEDHVDLARHHHLQLVILEFSPFDQALVNALLAACEANLPKEVEGYLARPQDPNARGDAQMLPIQVAAEFGHLEVMRLLIDAGADCNATTVDGTTALHLAAEEGHVEVVELLIQTGAEKNAATWSGKAALHFAAEDGHLEVVRLLLDAGAEKDAAAADGHTVLQAAVMYGHLEVVRLLLEAGADSNLATFDGHRPLHLAALNGRFEVVQELLQYGAEINAATVLGATALHCAVQIGNLKIVRLLLGLGAEQNARKEDGTTASRSLIGILSELLQNTANALRVSLFLRCFTSVVLFGGMV